jgi:phosphoserine/homoserine phosphotransferase
MISGIEMCKEEHKKLTLEYMNSLNFRTIAIGDSLNDLGMLEEADIGILFKSSNSIKSKYTQYYSCDTYSDLLIKIHKTFNK